MREFARSVPLVRAGRHHWLELAFMCQLILLSCADSTPPPPSLLPDRDPSLALRLYREEKALILDVRTPGEFREKHIAGAANIWVVDLAERIDEVENLAEGDKSRPIIVYCTAGVRAASAKDVLLRAGYAKVSNLGGLESWPGPVERSAN